jgi:anti-anti-sigma factor
MPGGAMVVEYCNNTAVIKFPKKLIHPDTNDFIKAGREALDKGIFELFIDFSETKLVDSAAIGALVFTARDYKAHGVTITLRKISESIHELFVDTGFDKIFNIESKEGIKLAERDLFENSVDIRLYIEKEIVGPVCVFHLSGLMSNPQGSKYFKRELLLAMAHNKKILLDLKDLTYFDSLSISVVLNMNRLIKETGGSLRICGSNDIVDELFNTLNIHQIIAFFKDQEEALAQWD